MLDIKKIKQTQAVAMIVSLTTFSKCLVAAPTLEEIIVVAQKKPESLQDAPISISAFSADSLEKFGIDGVGDLGPQVPNMDIRAFPTSATTLRIFIRGIGLNDIQITQDAPIGVYMNGVFIARSTGLALDIVDLQSMEVLRGPQGTLYGRNSVGGAINMTTIPPSMDAVQFSQKLTTGNRDFFQARTMVNFPLTDRVAAKFAYVYSEKDGYLKNRGPGKDFYDKKSEGGRFDLRYLVNDSITVDYAYDFTRAEMVAPAFQATLGPNPGDNIYGDAGFFQGQLGDIINYYPEEQRQSHATTFLNLRPSDDTINGHSLIVSWDFENLTLKSISAYRELQSKQYSDLAAGPSTDYRLISGHPVNLLGVNPVTGILANSPPNISEYFGGQTIFNVPDARRITDQDQMTQEFQLVGSLTERMDFVGGLYYFSEHGREVLPVSWGALSVYESTLDEKKFTGALMYEDLKVNNQSTAVFTQMTYTPELLSDQLHLTLGLRYTEDEREAKLVRLRDSIFPGFLFEQGEVFGAFNETASTGLIDNQKKSFTNFSYSFTAAYDVSDDINTYTKLSTAYKSGGYNTRALPRVGRMDAFSSGFDEETVKAYELGLKGEFFDRRLRVNAAVFYTEYNDIQLNLSIDKHLVLEDGSKPNINATTADTDVFNGGYAQLSGIELDITAVVSERLIATLNYGYLDANFEEVNDPRPENIEQLYFASAPQHSYTLSFDYTIGQYRFANLDANINYNFTDERYATADVGMAPQMILDDFNLLNARLTLSAISLLQGEMRIALWGKNLANKDYVTDAISMPHTERAVLFGEPRSYGLDISFDY